MRYFGNNIKLMVNNLMVNYTDQGADDAPVIIFIHGFPLNKTMWNKQLECLRERYRVIAYDIRGHGESDAGADDFSIKLFATDLIAFMDVLKVAKATVCGISIGGYIALNAIENYPERFEALVLADTTCKADNSVAKEKRMTTIKNIFEKGVHEYAAGSVKNMFALQSFTTKKSEISAVKQMIINTSEDSLGCTLVALAERKETSGKLTAIQVPVLILVGKEDKITPPGAAIYMHVLIENSLIHSIGNAAHLSNMENPDEFNIHLTSFLVSVYKDYYNIKVPEEISVLRELRNKVAMLLSFKSI